MIAGIAIEGNTLRVATLDEMGFPVLNQVMGKDYLTGRLLISHNHVYTDAIIDKLRLASPGLQLFDLLLTPRNNARVEDMTTSWSRKQLLALLFKKVLFTLNSQDIDLITQINLLCPSNFSDLDYQEVKEALQLNHIFSLQRISTFYAIENFLRRNHPEFDKKSFTLVDLGEHLIEIKTKEYAKALRIPSILHLFYEDILRKRPKIISETSGNDIEKILLELDSKTIYYDFLNQQLKPSYHLQSHNTIFQYFPEEHVIEDHIINFLKDFFKPIIKNNISFFLTGRLIQSAKIRDLISSKILPNHELNFDQENAAKLKGLFTEDTIKESKTRVPKEEEYAFLQDIVIDNESI